VTSYRPQAWNLAVLHCIARTHESCGIDKSIQSWSMYLML